MVWICYNALYKENRIREERLEREIRKDNEIYEQAEGDEELEI